MANVLNKITLEYRLSVNTPEYSPDEWLINPIIPDCDQRYFKIVGDEVLEMSQEEKAAIDNPPESIESRHIREQLEGVTLDNGWKIKYSKADRDEFGALKNTIDLIGDQIEQAGGTVPIFEADGTMHQLQPSAMLLILREYTMKALLEYSRQASELYNQV